jgi:quercetin dioxygenase-like cupin family protein
MLRDRNGKAQHSTVKWGNGCNPVHCRLTTPSNVSDCVRASPSGDANEKKEINMRKRLTCGVLLGAAIVVVALHYVSKANATPSSGFTSTTLSLGRLGNVDVTNDFVSEKGRIWVSSQNTKGQSDLYVQSNVWDPGGTTGWHSHPGHSLITVTAGTVTGYEGHDPNCKPHVYTTGMSFVDHGGDHVHILRNEGSVQASTIAVQLVPAGQPRRIDAPDPGNCHF